MAIYETVFLARSELSAKQVEDLTEQFSKILETGPEGHDAKGKILKTESWGLRTLAYKINKSKKAHYVLIESETTGQALIEAERVMRIHEDVMRYISIKLDTPSTSESALLKKEESRDNYKKDYRNNKKEEVV